MLTEGLLWFDDEPRRPLSEKIADAIARYSERTGWQPTVCEMHPIQVEAFNAEVNRAATATARRRAPEGESAAKRPAKPGAAPAVTLPSKLRVTPNASLRPNYFFIGIEAGERPRKAVSQSASATPRKAGRRAAATAVAASEPTIAAMPRGATKPRVKAS